MKIPTNEIVAERKLYSTKDPKSEIWVRIGIPKKIKNGLDFRCQYEITGFLEDKILEGAGVDSFQALQSALFCIFVDVSHLNKTSFGGSLRWYDDNEIDLGFDDLIRKAKVVGAPYI